MMFLLRQQGHSPNFLTDSSMHLWQYILVQHELSTASLASSRQRGQVKLSSMLVINKYIEMDEDASE